MTTESMLELGLLAVVLSSIWMVFVLTVRTVVARWLGARWAYYLWLVPLLGLLAMTVPSHPVQQMFNVPAIEVPVVNSMIDSASGVFHSAVKPGETRALEIPATNQLTVQDWLLTTWLLGTLLSLLYFSIRSFQFTRVTWRSSLALTRQQASIIQTRCARLANSSFIAARMLPSQRGPAVIGLLRPTLYLPVDFFQRFSSQQQVLILAHEYQHLRRHDLMCLLLARIYRCIFWFNPLVYVAERYLQLDQELSVDEKVLATTDRATRRLYGETLLLSSHGGFSLAQVSYSPTFSQFKQRTRLLGHYHQTVLGSLLGGLLLMIATGTSMTYGVLGGLELAPDFSIREALRTPMTNALEQLENESIDHAKLTAMLTSLKRLETSFPNQPLSDNESAQLNDLLALVYYKKGEFEHAIKTYQKVVLLTEKAPEHRTQALNSIAGIQFTQANYVEAIKALVALEEVSPDGVSAEQWALRSEAFVKLHQWNQGLRYINKAISQAQTDDELPLKNWLLSQAALEWKLGDLASAARSLEKSMEIEPGTTYENTLVAFNEWVQEVREPAVTERYLAQF